VTEVFLGVQDSEGGVAPAVEKLEIFENMTFAEDTLKVQHVDSVDRKYLEMRKRCIPRFVNEATIETAKLVTTSTIWGHERLQIDHVLDDTLYVVENICRRTAFPECWEHKAPQVG
jgi:hypothetical protein